MRNPRRLRWLAMAALDILIVSVALPLDFYVALQWDGAGFTMRFGLLMGLAILLNAASYSLGWLVSYLIYTKGDSDA